MFAVVCVLLINLAALRAAPGALRIPPRGPYRRFVIEGLLYMARMRACCAGDVLRGVVQASFGRAATMRARPHTPT